MRKFFAATLILCGCTADMSVPAWQRPTPPGEFSLSMSNLVAGEYFDYAISGTPIEIVDVKNDPAHRRWLDDFSVDFFPGDVFFVRLRH